MYQVLIDIQAIYHEKPTLEVREVTKLLQHDSTSSNDEFTSYAQSIKLIFIYCEGATLSKFIHEGRPTTTKRLSLLFKPSDEAIRHLYGIPGEENPDSAY